MEMQMREMRPLRNTGTRNIGALSPPRDLSVTDEITELQIRRDQNETLRNGVQTFSRDHQVCGRIPLFFTPSGQPRPVEEVAKELVGHFLICRESNVVMRIVETEAYQEHEQIFCFRFLERPPDFRSPAGRLVSYSNKYYPSQLLFITAGAADSEDAVLLRTCSAVHGNREIAKRVNLILPATQYEVANMITVPTKVHKALVPDLGRDCNLLVPSSGLYLAQKDPNPLIILDGPRILAPDSPSRIYSTMIGAKNRFRFALADCAQTLPLKSTLHHIVNQPVVRSTEVSLPASDGSIR